MLSSLPQTVSVEAMAAHSVQNSHSAVLPVIRKSRSTSALLSAFLGHKTFTTVGYPGAIAIFLNSGPNQKARP